MSKTDPKKPMKAAGGVDALAGKLLKAQRAISGLSQEKLGDAAGVTFQAIQRYENGTNAISIGRLFSICKALKVKPADFIKTLEDKTAPKPEIEEPFNRFLWGDCANDQGPSPLNLSSSELDFINLLRTAENNNLIEAARAILKNA